MKFFNVFIFLGLSILAINSFASAKQDDVITCNIDDRVVAIYTLSDSLEGLYLKASVLVLKSDGTFEKNAKYKQYDSQFEYENRGPRVITTNTGVKITVVPNLKDRTCSLHVAKAITSSITVEDNQLLNSQEPLTN